MNCTSSPGRIPASRHRELGRPDRPGGLPGHPRDVAGEVPRLVVGDRGERLGRTDVDEPGRRLSGSLVALDPHLIALGNAGEAVGGADGGVPPVLIRVLSMRTGVSRSSPTLAPAAIAPAAVVSDAEDAEALVAQQPARAGPGRRPSTPRARPGSPRRARPPGRPPDRSGRAGRRARVGGALRAGRCP